MSHGRPFDRVLVANRGEIACRVLATLSRMGIASVAVYSEADAGALHVRRADEAHAIGPAPVAESYLDGDRILAAARASGAQAIHPGYGLLSESADFAAACEAEGLVFLGPTPEQIADFGRKDRARALAEAAGVPTCPGTGTLTSLAEASAAAAAIGYPLLLKATAGGGGIGMALCRDEAELAEAFERVSRLGASHFGSSETFLERFVARARHVEVQIFGDGAGGVHTLSERDCSLQRRRQKVVEEAPAPGVSGAMRTALAAAAERLASAVGYRSAGTIEFLVDPEREAFYFLEVNTRLQVEHGVTEAIFGIDLVEWMLRVGAGEPLPKVPSPCGHAVEVRLYAEDPGRDFQPCSGTLSEVRFPEDLRVDTGVEPGTEVSPFYDPLLAKLVTHAPTRELAIAQMREGLEGTRLDGITTNRAYLAAILGWSPFRTGVHHTRSLEEFAFEPRALRVERPGAATTVQDFPGRLGSWGVGIPPSGPMDSLAFRIANRIVGNPDGAAGLELTLSGPALRFDHPAWIALTGAVAEATCGGEPVPPWTPVRVAAGQTLDVGRIGDGGTGPLGGLRAYLAVRGGLDVPDYLGAKATFTLGRLGGHAGRALVAGDTLEFGAEDGEAPLAPALSAEAAHALARLHPLHGESARAEAWELRVLDGPHGQGFFTEDDLREFYGATFEVHHQSARTGVRLIGPTPHFARPDGGDAGLHPSNVHDNAYAVGAVDFTGDMPVILGPDGPSLGGFVCPAVVIEADRWKLGQLRAGDPVRFLPTSEAEASEARAGVERAVASREAAKPPHPVRRAPAPLDDGILLDRAGSGDGPRFVVRRSGDRYLLIEFGPFHFDLALRIRVQLLHAALEQAVSAGTLPGIVDLTPGVRSLQVHFDPRRLSRDALLERLDELEGDLPAGEGLRLPSRVVHLPLSWEDPGAVEAMRRYEATVRDDAPWTPSNVEFIRRINGLDSAEDVRRIVFDAHYLVLGLGDVYLGAPVATPLDPRHRLVTTKYNPARTWTPENAVGIGGAYLCIYGMEGPGGYQLVGRTIPVWRTHGGWPGSPEGPPWLLRCFDQLRFFPVSAEELMDRRRDVANGCGDIAIEETVFEPAAHARFLDSIAEDTERFRKRQRRAFREERERWRASGELEAAARAERRASPEPAPMDALEEGVAWVTAPMGAQIVTVPVSVGEAVAAGDTLATLSAMKTESAVPAPAAGTVERIACQPGQVVAPGAPLVALREAS